MVKGVKMENEYPKDKFGKKIQKDNEKTIKNTFDILGIDEILNFCWNHRVEVLLQDDMQFHCFIDYPENTGSYGIEIDAFTSFIVGIAKYLGKI